MTLTAERNITTKLLIDDLDMWDEFDIKKESRPTNQHLLYWVSQFNRATNKNWCKLARHRWCKRLFLWWSKIQQEVFRALEDEWDDILEDYYANIDELIETIYNKGKQKGYSDIRQRIRFTETDRLALAFAREYNFDLITNLDDDVRNQIKNVITKGVIAGEHPSKIAPQILNVAEEQLEGSIFTPKQRATLIARTETSRIQNTGILQTYVNEGYTEVKILTAEDNNVCYTCLKYAFEFNENAEVTLENRGEERIHNIHELIKDGEFPPFHPLYRCTYLSVWESKGEPPVDAEVVDLTRGVQSTLDSFEHKQDKFKDYDKSKKIAKKLGYTYQKGANGNERFIDNDTKVQIDFTHSFLEELDKLMRIMKFIILNMIFWRCLKILQKYLNKHLIKYY